MKYMKYAVIAILVIALAVPTVMAAKKKLYSIPWDTKINGNLEVSGVIKGSWYKQISWYDITDIPAGFADGVDDTDDLVESSELDNICDVDGSIMKRIDGEWQCASDEVGETSGLTDNINYWLCTANDCSETCQVVLENGLIVDCEEAMWVYQENANETNCYGNLCDGDWDTKYELSDIYFNYIAPQGTISANYKVKMDNYKIGVMFNGNVTLPIDCLGIYLPQFKYNLSGCYCWDKNLNDWNQLIGGEFTHLYEEGIWWKIG